VDGISFHHESVNDVANETSTMRRASLAAGALLVCSAVSAMAQTSAVDRFVPAASLGDTVARCERVSPKLLKPGEQGYVLMFEGADSARRTVTGVWNAAGHLDTYTDSRGDLRGAPTPAARRGVRTTIAIDFPHKRAVLLNESHGQTRAAVLTTAAIALDAKHLGSPRSLLARLHAQCGAPPLSP